MKVWLLILIASMERGSIYCPLVNEIVNFFEILLAKLIEISSDKLILNSEYNTS
jgi:hypothetical protein